MDGPYLHPLAAVLYATFLGSVSSGVAKADTLLEVFREAEQRAAGEVLGLHRCVFLGYPDGFLEEGPELRGHVVRLIRTLKPDIVITWDGFRASFNHTDHRVVGRVVRDALFPAAHDPHYYSDLTRAGIGPWRTAEALLAATDSADVHVDIGPYLDRKADAIFCHTSQITAKSRDEVLENMRKWGKANKERRTETGYIYAESFKRIEFRRPPGAPGTPLPADAKVVQAEGGAPAKRRKAMVAEAKR